MVICETSTLSVAILDSIEDLGNTQWGYECITQNLILHEFTYQKSLTNIEGIFAGLPSWLLT